MTSFSIRNFGCRVNQAEAFDWAAELQRRGLRLDRGGGGAIVIVNTCTLTSPADRDSRKFIRRIRRENPTARIVVTGCLAERDPESLRTIPGVWKVIPNAAKDDLPDTVFAEARPGLPVEEFLEAAAPFRSRALVKVQDGCNNACGFCVIPSVRGRSRSVPLGEVREKVERLAGRGFREIVLTGIHLGSYGLDFKPPSSLLALLRAVEDLSGDFRARLSSLDPRLLPRPLLEFLVRSRRVCPHFHLSLQHGADPVLRAMGRASTAAEYRTLLAFLEEHAPEAALGADLIVGFPGETEADFEATRAFVEEAPLSYVHVFSFSPRPGTRAAAERPVDEGVKKRRATALRALAKRKNLLFRRRFVGRVLDGIVVKSSAAGGEVLTPNYLDVAVPAGGLEEGAAVRVRIDRVTEKETAGVVV